MEIGMTRHRRTTLMRKKDEERGRCVESEAEDCNVKGWEVGRGKCGTQG